MLNEPALLQLSLPGLYNSAFPRKALVLLSPPATNTLPSGSNVAV
jgi:hypothetical protein